VETVDDCPAQRARRRTWNRLLPLTCCCTTGYRVRPVCPLTYALNNGTIEPIMSAATENNSGELSDTLFSRNRRAILSLLFTRVDEEFYLREIVRYCGGGMGAIQRELAQLVRSGILRRTVRHKQVYFQAHAACPIFAELKNIILKTCGIAEVLRAALGRLGSRIEVAFLFGSFAKGRSNSDSDVDLMIVGDISFSEVVAALAESQMRIGREINPVVYPPGEFVAKLAAGHPFLQTVLQGEKVFLMGDESGIERMVAKRVVGGT
jgi:uncharacterized protein